MGLIVFWTNIAEDKLDTIFDYYKINVSTEIALTIVNGIIDRTINLEKNPLIGQKELLLENRKQEFRYLVYKNYKIIYWINNNKNRIEVATIFDTRRNPTDITNF